MNSTPLQGQIHPTFKGKTQHKPKNNRVRKQRVVENRSNRGEERPPWAGRGSHHGPWWTPRSSCGAHSPTRLVLPLRCVLVHLFGLQVFFPWVN